MKRRGDRGAFDGSFIIVTSSDAKLARGRLLYMDAAGQVEVDLAGLSDVDSATLAVLLAWSARAAQAGVALRYTAAPPSLLALARLCDAAPLLGIETQAGHA